MQVLRYPPGTLIGDYLRAGAGVGVGAGVLSTTPVGWTVGAIFGGILVLFGGFGLRTLERHMSRVAVTPEGVARQSFGVRHIPWDDLEEMKLRYYGTRRQERRDSGFMQLKLKGAGTTITFESNLEGFELVAWCATRAASANGIALDATSAGNLLALGIEADGGGPPPPGVSQMAAELLDEAAQAERQIMGEQDRAQRSGT